jgi:5-methylcytosine-specific restriction enzyme subunit McrC
METQSQHVRLKEQAFRPASLTRNDLRYLSALGFQVTFDVRIGESDTEGIISCEVNPNASVGHFRLPSGRIVSVEPKVETASIFRMLAYVYSAAHKQLLRDEDVQYAADRLLFEPLVELLNKLVGARARRGLVQDYIRREENLGSFRGALNITPHIQHNIERDNRVYCQFFEQTVDVPDNRVVKTALHHLLQFGGWTSGTTHALIANFHKFDAVTLDRRSGRNLAEAHYHRLNDDYRPIHELCRMFLAGITVSERVGAFGFRGFLLDMNVLFEQFVQKAFENVLRRRPARAEIQRSRTLSSNPVAPDIRPDVTVRSGDNVVAVADAKYKKDEGGPRNPDIYQVVVYGTVLRCKDVYLLYPQTELDSEHDIPIINSPVVVKTRRVDISTRDLVTRAEQLATKICTNRPNSPSFSTTSEPAFGERQKYDANC